MNYKLLAKKADHLYGHIYEHALTDRIVDLAIENKFLRLIDYNLWAEISDDNVIFDLAGDVAMTAAEKLANEPLPVAVIEKAVGQISCEYKRSYRIKNVEKLVHEINKINTVAWQDIYRAGILRDKGEENIYDAENIKYQRRSPKDFASFCFLYKLPIKYDKLRPLAVYIFRIIALNQIDLFYSKCNCFDEGDRWNSWGDYTGYAHYMVFRKGQFTEKSLREEFNKNLDIIIDQDRLMEKLVKYLHNTHPKDMYFRPGEIDEYSRYIVGSAGWKMLATRENIQTVLDGMKVIIRELPSKKM